MHFTPDHWAHAVPDAAGLDPDDFRIPALLNEKEFLDPLESVPATYTLINEMEEIVNVLAADGEGSAVGLVSLGDRKVTAYGVDLLSLVIVLSHREKVGQA